MFWVPEYISIHVFFPTSQLPSPFGPHLFWEEPGLYLLLPICSVSLCKSWIYNLRKEHALSAHGASN